MELDIGSLAFISIFVHLICIIFAWVGLQAIPIEKFIRSNHVFQARVLYVLIAVALGSTVGNFLLDYLYWAQNLPKLFS